MEKEKDCCTCGQSHSEHTHCEACTHSHNTHTRNEDGTCGENLGENTHGDGCTCGEGHGEHQHNHPRKGTRQLSELQAAFLHHLQHAKYMPLARFVVQSTTEPDFETVMLAPVYLSGANDTMGDVKAMGRMLLELEDMGEITLDYDIPLSNYPYEEYEASALYAYFCDTVKESAGKPGFLGDKPVLELGSIALAE